MGLELVSAQSYYLDTEYLSAESIDHSQEMQLVELSTHGEGESRSLMLVQTPMRPRMLVVKKAGLCFGCGGSHWLQDYPDKPIISYKGEILPLIERYCVGCSVDHLPKMCPTNKPRYLLGTLAQIKA